MHTKTLLGLMLVMMAFLSKAQSNEKVTFDYLSFSVDFNDSRDEKILGVEDLIQNFSRILKKENREESKELYYLKSVNQAFAILGENGFELVSAVPQKTQDGSLVRFYFKRRTLTH